MMNEVIDVTGLPTATPFTPPSSTPAAQENESGVSEGEGGLERSCVVAPRVGQQLFRFTHEGKGALAAMPTTQVRSALRPIFEAASADVMGLSIGNSERHLTLVSMTPEAAVVMVKQAMDVLAAIADLAGQVLETEAQRLLPSAQYLANQGIQHRITKLVVGGKNRRDWESWRSASLTPEQTETLEASIRSGLVLALKPWVPNVSNFQMLKVIDPGRPMIIAPAHGPHMLVRLGVRFITNHSIDGAVHIGPYAYAGMGRVMRIAAVD